MLTCCPNCKTSFRITPEQLKARQGKVRCGECQHVSNALDTLIDDPTLIRAAPPAAAFDRDGFQGAGMEAQFRKLLGASGKAVEAPARTFRSMRFRCSMPRPILLSSSQLNPIRLLPRSRTMNQSLFRQQRP